MVSSVLDSHMHANSSHRPCIFKQCHKNYVRFSAMNSSAWERDRGEPNPMQSAPKKSSIQFQLYTECVCSIFIICAIVWVSALLVYSTASAAVIFDIMRIYFRSSAMYLKLLFGRIHRHTKRMQHIGSLETPRPCHKYTIASTRNWVHMCRITATFSPNYLFLCGFHCFYHCIRWFCMCLMLKLSYILMHSVRQ